MKLIQLSSGDCAAQVSDRDFPELNRFTWHLRARRCGGFYVVRSQRVNGKYKNIYMHRSILGLSGNLQGEHRDGNGLNNQRRNLRIATRSQNLAAFRRPKRRGSSQFRGVSWSAGASKWLVYVGKKYVGLFDDEREAAKARDVAAVKIYGKFAALNFA